MKKWLTFLLLLVSMAAAFCPCCSKDNCCNEVLSSRNTDQNNHKCEGTCSPFITCGTCPGFVHSVKVIELPVIAQEKPVHHSRVISITLSSFTASLLQPP